LNDLQGGEGKTESKTEEPVIAPKPEAVKKRQRGGGKSSDQDPLKIGKKGGGGALKRGKLMTLE